MKSRLASCRRSAGARTTLLSVISLMLASCGGGGGNGPLPTPTRAPAATATPAPTATPSATPTPSGSPSPFPIAVGLEQSTSVAAAWGGDRYLVTFSAPTDRAEPDVVGVRLDQGGEAIDSAPVLLSDFGSEPFLSADAQYSPGEIAFADGAFGAFLFGAGTVTDDIPAQVVGFVSVPQDGSPLLPATAIDEQANFSTAQTSLRSPIAATTNGTLFLGMYQRILTLVGSFSVSQVFGQIVTLTDSGIAAQPVGPLSGMPPVDGMVTSGSAPGVAISSAATLVAWVGISAPESSPSDITTSVTGVLLTEGAARSVSLSETAEGSQNVAVASDGTDFLVVWTATTAADPVTLSELRALRYTAGGRVEPEGGFLVAGGSRAKSLGRVVFAGGVYLIAWIEDGVLRGARLGSAGEAALVFTIDPGPVNSVDLASDGERVLAVFNRAEGSTTDVVGTFVPVE